MGYQTVIKFSSGGLLIAIEHSVYSTLELCHKPAQFNYDENDIFMKHSGEVPLHFRIPHKKLSGFPKKRKLNGRVSQ